MSTKKLIPMFKWSGGKRRELSHVEKHLPDEFDKFYEPFVGGGAVWFHLQNNKNVVGDVNRDVINFYTVTKNHGKAFIDDLNSIGELYRKTIKDTQPKKREEFKPLADLYYQWRDGEYTTDYDLAKRFYVLRNLAFGGMLRYNRAGKFNVPYGYYKNFKTLAWNKEYQRLFSGTDFKHGSWKDTVASATANDFIFLDPPYTRTFTKYTPEGDFGNEDHRDLAKWFASTKSKAMIILNKDDFTSQLYKDFICEEYEFSYGVRYRKDRIDKDDVTTRHFVAVNYQEQL